MPSGQGFYHTSSFMFGNVCLLPSYLPTILACCIGSGFFYELWILFYCLLAIITLSFLLFRFYLLIYLFWERKRAQATEGVGGRERISRSEPHVEPKLRVSHVTEPARRPGTNNAFDNFEVMFTFSLLSHWLFLSWWLKNYVFKVQKINKII